MVANSGWGCVTPFKTPTNEPWAGLGSNISWLDIDSAGNCVQVNNWGALLYSKAGSTSAWNTLKNNPQLTSHPLSNASMASPHNITIAISGGTILVTDSNGCMWTGAINTDYSVSWNFLKSPDQEGWII